MRENLVSDKTSFIFKHIQDSEHCRALCSVDCFHTLDHASISFQLKIKEAFHIQREQPFWNQQLLASCINLKLLPKTGYLLLAQYHVVLVFTGARRPLLLQSSVQRRK